MIQVDFAFAENPTVVGVATADPILEMDVKYVGGEDFVEVVDPAEIVAKPPIVHGIEIDAEAR